MKTKDTEIDCRARMRFNTTQRRINSSACTYTAFNKRRKEQKAQGRRQQSEAKVIKTRECHIRSSNKNWNKSVTKSSNKNRHYKEKNHNEGVGRHDNIVKLVVSKEKKVSRCCKLKANKDTKRSPDYTCCKTEKEI